MTSRDLQSLLRQLHAELERAHSLDPESRRLLDVVVDDVRRVEASGERRVAVSGEMRDASAATPGGLEALAVRFEAEHPTLAASLRGVADVLGKAGI